MIKKYLRIFLIDFASLWLVSRVLSGISFDNKIEILIYASLTLTIINFIVKPLIKLLLLPINILTLGAFRWLANVIALYLVTQIIPQFRVESFTFPGFAYQGFIIPSFHLGIFLAFVVASLLLSLISNLFFWIIS